VGAKLVAFGGGGLIVVVKVEFGGLGVTVRGR